MDSITKRKMGYSELSGGLLNTITRLGPSADSILASNGIFVDPDAAVLHVKTIRFSSVHVWTIGFSSDAAEWLTQSTGG